MPNPKKVETVKRLQEILKDVPYIFFADYKGMRVNELQTLKRQLREKGATFTVVKNTLTHIALSNLGMQDTKRFLKGPTAIIIAKDDPGSVLKAVLNFDKERNLPAVKGGIVEGRIVEENQIEALSKLPSREVLLAQLLGTLQAPTRGLVTVLSGTIRGLVVALNQIKEAKEKAS